VIPIAVFASGRGSNFQAILRSIQQGRLSARVTALVCDRPEAAAIGLARQAGIPVIVERHEEAMLQALRKYDETRFAVFAGYMRIVTKRFLDAFRSERGYARVTNIHPSLLPAFPGLNSYSQAYEYGTPLAGVSVHFVEEAIDAGPICAQESFPISDCRSAEEVESRGLAVEHRLYSETLSWVLPEKFDVELRNRRLCVRQN
jgi:phosphoribosylglycinamide formyltransferase-1